VPFVFQSTFTQLIKGLELNIGRVTALTALLLGPVHDWCLDASIFIFSLIADCPLLLA